MTSSKPMCLLPRRLSATAIRRCLPLLLALLLPTSTALGGNKQDARKHFIEGLRFAERAQYVMALGEFMASFELHPHPTTAFNIAKAYDDKGDLERALRWYRRFQSLAPDRAPEAAEAVLRIHEALDPVSVPAATEAEAPASEDKPSLSEVLDRIEASED